MKEIPLTQGLVALVDDEDYAELAQFKWYALRRTTGIYYAVRSVWKNPKRMQEFMHRRILGLQRGDIRETDHRNRNGLDNRKSNLRICSTSQNQMNRRPPHKNISGFKGVSYDPRRNRPWMARIIINRKEIFLGYFSSPKEAHQAYVKAAKKLFGDFARFI